MPKWPVYIVEDSPATLTFKVELKPNKKAGVADFGASYLGEDLQRQYALIETRHRLHQQQFRERILHAYREQCAMCRLRHPELLEAIHIIPDSEPKGDPIVPNGISLCNLHHAAFDRFILGIRPDYIVEVRKDILEEEDGPILQHGLQELNNQKIILPHSHKNYPDPERLEIRYSKFKSFIPN
jgi:putative restriction endonuclease